MWMKFLPRMALRKQAAIAVACLALFGALSAAPPAQAANLNQAFQQALAFEPEYQAVLAKREADRLGVQRAQRAFYPEASVSASASTRSNGTTNSLTVTQPLYSRDRQLLRQQAEPLDQQSLAELLGQRQSLANRLLQATTDLVLANENLRLSAVKLDALRQQANRAAELRRGGLGTVTDQRDVEVRLAQAEAERLRLENERDSAAQRYAAITGSPPTLDTFVLPARHQPVPLQSADDYLAQALRGNAALQQGQAGLRVSQIGVQRAQSIFYPNLVATASHRKGGNTETAVGVLFSLPLGYGTVADIEGAAIAAQRAELALRGTEANLRLQVRNAVASLDSSNRSLDIQRQAIAAAELSVEANQQSYQGGVRSSVDVLNAIQTLYTVQSEYVALATARAQTQLALLTLLGTDGADALAQIQQSLFASQQSPAN
jgi:outer membrane protein, protease secretion system